MVRELFPTFMGSAPALAAKDTSSEPPATLGNGMWVQLLYESTRWQSKVAQQSP